MSSQRQRRFQDFLTAIIPDSDKLQNLSSLFEEQFGKSVLEPKIYNTTQENQECRLIETGVVYESFTKRETGTFHCVSIEPKGVRIGCVTLQPSIVKYDKQTYEVFVPYTSVQNKSLTECVESFTEAEFTATIFIETFISAIKQYVQKVSPDKNLTKPICLTLSTCYFLDKTRGRDEFLHFEELFTDHIKTNDSLCDIDITYLCNVQLIRNNIPAKVIGAISHTTALLLGTSYETKKHQPACLVSLKLDEKIQLSYVQPNAQELGFIGSIVDVDISNFNGNKVDPSTYCTVYGLPYIMPDFETKITRIEDRQFFKDFEKLTSATCLPEICRRSIIHILQTETPKSVWIPNSLSITDCLSVLSSTDEREHVPNLLKNIWNWDASTDDAQAVKKIIISVFSRSAALVAVVLAYIAKRTGRLQPALGGVSVSLCGLLGSHQCYRDLLRFYLDKIFKRETAKLLMFQLCQDGPIKGGAIFASRIITSTP